MKINILKNKIHFSSLIVFSIFLIFAFFPSVADSSIGFSINPQKFELDVFPGEDFESKISISNRSDFALPVSVRAITFTADEETGKMVFIPSGDETKFPGLWFEFDQKDIILEPAEKREINFQINIPQDVEPGGYSAFILFEPRIPMHYFEEGAARTIPAIGAPALISVKSFYLDWEDRDELEIVEFSMRKEERLALFEGAFGALENMFVAAVHAQERVVQASGGKPSSFILRIKNNSAYHLRPQGTAVIKNMFGRVVGEIDIPSQTILPGKVRAFPVELINESNVLEGGLWTKVSNLLSESMFAGRYRVELNVSSPHILGSGNTVAQARSSLVLYSIPWISGVVALMFVFFLVFLIKNRSRINLALKTFIRKS